MLVVLDALQQATRAPVVAPSGPALVLDVETIITEQVSATSSSTTVTAAPPRLTLGLCACQVMESEEVTDVRVAPDIDTRPEEQGPAVNELPQPQLIHEPVILPVDSILPVSPLVASR